MGNFINALQNYEFLRNALYTSVMVGIIAGVIGSFIILRGMSLMGDAISHAVVPGVAVSYMLGQTYFIGASVFGLLSAVIIGFITRKSKIKSDTAIGIVFSAFLALGMILISFAQSSTDLNHILFGNVLAVKQSDMILTAVIGAIVILFVVVFFKELKMTSFDETTAKVAGIPVAFFHYALILLLTLVSVAALQTVGSILVIAMLITPAATAYLLTHRLQYMVVLSALFGSISAVVGLYFSYTYNLASGAAIVLVSAFLFLLAFLFSPQKGLLFSNRQNRSELA